MSFYLGKEVKHSDWRVSKVVAEVDPEVNRRLDEIETLMRDTDKDGVLDYLDFQNNTPSGVIVDSKGRYIDANRNGTPDEFEPKIIESFKNKNLEIQTQKAESTAFTSMLDRGLVNVFYEVNESEPNRGSANTIFGLISLLKKNPSLNIKLVGYSDNTGNVKFNKRLSELRVKKLLAILISNGISSSRFKILGQGIDNSSSSNSETALQLARRVSVQID